MKTELVTYNEISDSMAVAVYCWKDKRFSHEVRLSVESRAVRNLLIMIERNPDVHCLRIVTAGATQSFERRSSGRFGLVDLWFRTMRN